MLFVSLAGRGDAYTYWRRADMLGDQLSVARRVPFLLRRRISYLSRARARALARGRVPFNHDEWYVFLLVLVFGMVTTLLITCTPIY
jgi:hypothetical protein